MPEIINKNNVTLDEAINSKSLKKKSDEELERMLQTLLTTDHDNDSTVNTIIAELSKRGISSNDLGSKGKINDDKIKKAFDDLNLDLIEKSTKNKHWHLENGKRIYDDIVNYHKDLKSEINKVEKLLNSGKSCSVKKSIELLKEMGFEVDYEQEKGYVDKKAEGQRFVISRKEKLFYKVIVKNNNQIINTFDSQTTSSTAYSLSNFVVNSYYKHIKENNFN